MEFDKSRVYTAVNADELKPGDRVIVAYNMYQLKEQVKMFTESVVNEIETIYDECYCNRFNVKHGENYPLPLAYLVERAENCTNCGCVHCWYREKHGIDEQRLHTCSRRIEPKTKQGTENCTNCVYEGSAGCSVVEICGENKLTHRCHMYKAKDTKRNLCSSCKHSFAECSATTDDIIFGDGVGNDNVYECDKYEQKSTVRCINCEHYSTYEGYCNKQVKPTRYDNTCSDYLLAKPKTEQKAEKKYRPFKDTDELIKVWCERGGKWSKRELSNPHIWVRYKESPYDTALIVGMGGENGGAYIIDRWYDEYDLLEKFTFLDGSACGVEE